MCEQPIRKEKNVTHTRGGERSKPADDLWLAEGWNSDQLHPSPHSQQTLLLNFHSNVILWKEKEKGRAKEQLQSFTFNYIKQWCFMKIFKCPPFHLFSVQEHTKALCVVSLEYIIGRLSCFIFWSQTRYKPKAHLNLSETLMSIHTAWLRQASFSYTFRLYTD